MLKQNHFLANCLRVVDEAVKPNTFGSLRRLKRTPCHLFGSASGCVFGVLADSFDVAKFEAIWRDRHNFSVVIVNDPIGSTRKLVAEAVLATKVHKFDDRIVVGLLEALQDQFFQGDGRRRCGLDLRKPLGHFRVCYSLNSLKV